jgi:undecaprenyl-diphosphatase
MTSPVVTTEASVRPWRGHVISAAAVLGLSAVSVSQLLAAVQHGSGPALWDGPTLTWMVAHRTPVATSVLTVVSWFGPGIYYWSVALLVVALLAVRRRWVDALLFMLAVVGADVVSRVMKQAVQRPRPPAAFVVGPFEPTFAFPSGHTIAAAAFALAAAYVWWRGRRGRARAVVGVVLALAVTALMATSRLYLADHWLTDVLASTVLALGILAVVALLDIYLDVRVLPGLVQTGRGPSSKGSTVRHGQDRGKPGPADDPTPGT